MATLKRIQPPLPSGGGTARMAGVGDHADEETCESEQSSGGAVPDGTFRDLSYASLSEGDTVADDEPVTVSSSISNRSLWGRFMRRIRGGGSLASGSDHSEGETDSQHSSRGGHWDAGPEEEQLP